MLSIRQEELLPPRPAEIDRFRTGLTPDSSGARPSSPALVPRARGALSGVLAGASVRKGSFWENPPSARFWISVADGSGLDEESRVCIGQLLTALLHRFARAAQMDQRLAFAE